MPLSGLHMHLNWDNDTEMLGALKMLDDMHPKVLCLESLGLNVLGQKVSPILEKGMMFFLILWGLNILGALGILHAFEGLDPKILGLDHYD